MSSEIPNSWKLRKSHQSFSGDAFDFLQLFMMSKSLNKLVGHQTSVGPVLVSHVTFGLQTHFNCGYSNEVNLLSCNIPDEIVSTVMSGLHYVSLVTVV